MQIVFQDAVAALDPGMTLGRINSRALIGAPRLIVWDEPVSPPDVSIQPQVVNRLLDWQQSKWLALVFNSHNLWLVRDVSHQMMAICLGSVKGHAPGDAFCVRPLDPCLQALPQAIPEPDPARERRRRGRPLAKGLPCMLNPPPAGSLPAAARWSNRVATSNAPPCATLAAAKPPAVSSRPEMTLSPARRLAKDWADLPQSSNIHSSADGRSAFWCLAGVPETEVVWCCPTDGSTPRERLTRGQDHFLVRDVSSDGMRLIPAQSIHVCEHDLLLRPPDRLAGRLRQLTRAQSSHHPYRGAFIPDGSGVIFIGDFDHETAQVTPGGRIGDRDLTGGTRNGLACNDTPFETGPRLSRDGTGRLWHCHETRLGPHPPA